MAAALAPTSPSRFWRLAAAVTGALLVVSGCAKATDAPAPSAASVGAAAGATAVSRTAAAATPASTLTGTINVFAAASLTEAFTKIGAAFEAAHPGVNVVFNFGASSALAQQIVSGAPADVFAAANQATMETVVAAGDARAPQVFVTNRLEIAVPANNPGKVTGLADFAKSELKIALCAPKAPCGAAAITALKAAGITAAPDTLEQDVKGALTKVILGEVDAALVYRTDVLAAGDKVQGIAFPEADRAVNAYPVATLAEAPSAAGAQAFVAYVLSQAGQQVLTAAGFGRP